MSLAEKYVTTCQRQKIKPNSGMIAALAGEEPMTKLDLSNNYCGGESGFECVLQIVQDCPTLVELDLSGNFLNTDNVKRLVACAWEHPGLSTLRLNRNRLYIESGKELVRLARFNKRIKAIEFTDTADGDATANHVPQKIVDQLSRELQRNAQ